MADCLLQKDSYGSTGWRSALGKGLFFAKMIALAKKHNDMSESLAAALKIKNDYDDTGLHSIVRYADRGQFVEMLKLNKTVLVSIVHSLTAKNKGGMTGLEYVKHFAPEQLAECEKLVKDKLYVIFRLESDGSLQSIIRALWKSTREHNVTPWFFCGAESNAEITYRQIQKIYQNELPSTERTLSVVALLSKFIAVESNRHPFVVALKDNLHVESITPADIEAVRKRQVEMPGNFTPH